MNKQDLIELIANRVKVSKRASANMLDTFIGEITNQLRSGRKVTVTGFGTFTVSNRSARSGVNPRNPEERISIPALKTPHFKAGKTFKEAIRTR